MCVCMLADSCLQYMREVQTQVLTPPTVLAIHFKRFAAGASAPKVSSQIDFRASLNLQPFMYKQSQSVVSGHLCLCHLHAAVLACDGARASVNVGLTLLRMCVCVCACACVPVNNSI